MTHTYKPHSQEARPTWPFKNNLDYTVKFCLKKSNYKQEPRKPGSPQPVLPHFVPPRTWWATRFYFCTVWWVFFLYGRICLATSERILPLHPHMSIRWNECQLNRCFSQWAWLYWSTFRRHDRMVYLGALVAHFSISVALWTKLYAWPSAFL